MGKRVPPPRPIMRLSLTLLGSLFWASSLHAQAVILDLDEGYGEGAVGQFYFLTYDAESAVRLGSNRDGHRGRAAEAAWRVEAGPGGLGYAGFGYLHAIASDALGPSYAFPDLAPYTHLSLWYNNVAPADGAERVAFRFELHEDDVEADPDGSRGRQVWVYQTDAVLTTPAGWTELLIPLVEADEVGGDGFAVSPGGFRGDGALDLDRIRHWAVVLLLDDEPVGTVVEGTTRFDYLTAVSLPVAAGPGPAAPAADALHAAHPNPFGTAATLSYTLAEPANVSLRVYDVLGREVAVLVEPRDHAPGHYEVALDGARLAAGTYVCVLEVGDARHTRVVTRSR